MLVPKSSTDNYRLGRGIDKLFWHMSKNAPLKFLNCCETYVKNETPFWNGSITIVKCLTDLLGFDKSRTFMLEHDFRVKYQWIVLLCSLVTDDRIDQEIESDIMLCLNMLEKDIGSIADLNMILRVDNRRNGFLISYMTRLNAVCQKRQHIVSHFLQDVVCYEEFSAPDFLSHFDDSNIMVLCDAYILALCGDCNFDYEGKLLSGILQSTPNFIIELIFAIVGNRLYNRDITCLDTIWEQDNYNSLVSLSVEALFNADDWLGEHKKICEMVLNRRSKKTDIMERQHEWIMNYISNHAYDDNRIKFIFNVLCNGDEQMRYDVIIQFCTCNKSIDSFASLPLLPTSMFWSGSEVPMIERRIGFLNRICTALKGGDFIEHRAVLSQRISNLEERKNSVLLEEFLENR